MAKNIPFKLILEKAKDYQADMTRFLRDMVAIPSESCDEKRVVHRIKENNVQVDTLFGPAYKGIPLATACSIALFNKYGIDVNYAFDRKEAKDHGEGGVIVGRKMEDGEKIAIIEDVITAGTAIRTVLPLLKEQADVDITALIISVDRMEKGKGELSAVQEVKKDFGINVYSIVTMEDIIDAIKNDIIPGKEYLDKMIEYRNIYGV